jgi:hypothetical protein
LHLAIGVTRLPSRMVRFRMVGLTGQSLPACVRLLRIDVSWGDQQIVHKGRSPMSYDSFLVLSDLFDTQDLSRKSSPVLLKEKSNWKRITLPT